MKRPLRIISLLMAVVFALNNIAWADPDIISRSNLIPKLRAANPDFKSKWKVAAVSRFVEGPGRSLKSKLDIDAIRDKLTDISNQYKGVFTALLSNEVFVSIPEENAIIRYFEADKEKSHIQPKLPNLTIADLKTVEVNAKGLFKQIIYLEPRAAKPESSGNIIEFPGAEEKLAAGAIEGSEDTTSGATIVCSFGEGIEFLKSRITEELAGERDRPVTVLLKGLPGAGKSRIRDTLRYWVQKELGKKAAVVDQKRTNPLDWRSVTFRSKRDFYHYKDIVIFELVNQGPDERGPRDIECIDIFARVINRDESLRRSRGRSKIRKDLGWGWWLWKRNQYKSFVDSMVNAEEGPDLRRPDIIIDNTSHSGISALGYGMVEHHSRPTYKDGAGAVQAGPLRPHAALVTLIVTPLAILGVCIGIPPAAGMVFWASSIAIFTTALYSIEALTRRAPHSDHKLNSISLAIMSFSTFLLLNILSFFNGMLYRQDTRLPEPSGVPALEETASSEYRENLGKEGQAEGEKTASDVYREQLERNIREGIYPDMGIDWVITMRKELVEAMDKDAYELALLVLGENNWNILGNRDSEERKNIEASIIDVVLNRARIASLSAELKKDFVLESARQKSPDKWTARDFTLATNAFQCTFKNRKGKGGLYFAENHPRYRRDMSDREKEEVASFYATILEIEDVFYELKAGKRIGPTRGATHMHGKGADLSGWPISNYARTVDIGGHTFYTIKPEVLEKYGIEVVTDKDGRVTFRKAVKKREPQKRPVEKAPVPDAKGLSDSKFYETFSGAGAVQKKENPAKAGLEGLEQKGIEELRRVGQEAVLNIANNLSRQEVIDSANRFIEKAASASFTEGEAFTLYAIASLLMKAVSAETAKEIRRLAIKSYWLGEREIFSVDSDGDIIIEGDEEEGENDSDYGLEEEINALGNAIGSLEDPYVIIEEEDGLRAKWFELKREAVQEGDEELIGQLDEILGDLNGKVEDARAEVDDAGAGAVQKKESGIATVFINGVELTGKKLVRRIKRLSRERSVFNADIFEGILMLDSGHAHAEIEGHPIGMHTLRGTVDQGGFWVVVTPTQDESKIQGQMSEYRDDCIRLARFFVENGFPEDFRLMPIMRDVWRYPGEERCKYFPKTVGELAGLTLSSEENADKSSAGAVDSRWEQKILAKIKELRREAGEAMNRKEYNAAANTYDKAVATAGRALKKEADRGFQSRLEGLIAFLSVKADRARELHEKESAGQQERAKSEFKEALRETERMLAGKAEEKKRLAAIEREKEKKLEAERKLRVKKEREEKIKRGRAAEASNAIQTAVSRLNQLRARGFENAVIIRAMNEVEDAFRAYERFTEEFGEDSLLKQERERFISLVKEAEAAQEEWKKERQKILAAVTHDPDELLRRVRSARSKIDGGQALAPEETIPVLEASFEAVKTSLMESLSGHSRFKKTDEKAVNLLKQIQEEMQELPAGESSEKKSSGREVKYPSLLAMIGEEEIWASRAEIEENFTQGLVPRDPELLKKLGIEKGDRIYSYASWAGDWVKALAEILGSENIKATDASAPVVKALKEKLDKHIKTEAADAILSPEPEEAEMFDWTFSFEPIPIKPDALTVVLMRGLLTRKGSILVYRFARPDLVKSAHSLMSALSKIYGTDNYINTENIKGMPISSQTGSDGMKCHILTLATNESARMKALTDLAILEALDAGESRTVSDVFRYDAVRRLNLAKDVMMESLERISRISEAVNGVFEPHPAGEPGDGHPGLKTAINTKTFIDDTDTPETAGALDLRDGFDPHRTVTFFTSRTAFILHCGVRDFLRSQDSVPFAGMPEDGVAQAAFAINLHINAARAPGKTAIVIPKSLIPAEQEKLASSIERASRKSISGEQIKFIDDSKGIDHVMQEVGRLVANGYAVNIALIDKGHVDSLPTYPDRPDIVKALVFEKPDGVFDFIRIDAMIAGLRALSVDDLRDREMILKAVYRLISGEDYKGEFPQVSDPREFAKLFIIKLPKAGAVSMTEIEKENERMLELLLSA